MSKQPSFPVFPTREETMKTVLTTGLAAVALVLAAEAAPAYGGGCCPAPCYAPCYPQVTVTWVEKEVTAYKPAWKTKEVEYTYNKVTYKKVSKPYTCTVLQPYTTTESRTCTVLQPYTTTESRTCTVY